jgi:hypothetical protein
MAMDMIKKLNHDASVYSYKHLLCFEGVEKFLKVCDEVGGNFGIFALWLLYVFVVFYMS